MSQDVTIFGTFTVDSGMFWMGDRHLVGDIPNDLTPGVHYTIVTLTPGKYVPLLHFDPGVETVTEKDSLARKLVPTPAARRASRTLVAPQLPGSRATALDVPSGELLIIDPARVWAGKREPDPMYTACCQACYDYDRRVVLPGGWVGGGWVANTLYGDGMYPVARLGELIIVDTSEDFVRLDDDEELDD